MRALVAVGSYLPGSGFTRVLQSTFAELSSEVPIHWVGTGYKGEVIQRDGYTLHPSNLQGGDVYGAFGAARLARELDAFAVLVLNDLWMLTAYVPALCEKDLNLPIVAYCPLDGRIVDDGHCRRIAPFHTLVSYTDFGRRQFAASYDRIATADPGISLPRLEVIGHGVDLQRFRPLTSEQRIEWRRRLFPELDDPEQTLLVLNANRPTPRKRIDLTLEVFADSIKGASSRAYLCLHQALANDAERQALRTQADELGIADRLLWIERRLSDEELNGLYNACQIGINTATGEGWGLIAFEHAATGAAQLLPDSSACAELWQDSAVLMPIARRLKPFYSELEMAEIDTSAAAGALRRLIEDETHRQHIAAAGQANAGRPEWRWSAIADDWLGQLRAIHDKAHETT